MRCYECYWCIQECADSAKVCHNQCSVNYNKVLTPEQLEAECDDAETEQAVDYHRLNCWEFARKYYM